MMLRYPHHTVVKLMLIKPANRVKLLAVVATASLLGGCNFVQLSDAGADVFVRHAADTAQCTSVGVVSAKTKSKVLVSRSETAIVNELVTLAKNEAAKLGANTIVPIGIVQEGEQSYRAYTCGEPSP